MLVKNVKGMIVDTGMKQCYKLIEMRLGKSTKVLCFEKLTSSTVGLVSQLALLAALRNVRARMAQQVPIATIFRVLLMTLVKLTTDF